MRLTLPLPLALALPVALAVVLALTLVLSLTLSLYPNIDISFMLHRDIDIQLTIILQYTIV